MSLNEFAWNCFRNSGSVEAFLLYKHEGASMGQQPADEEQKSDESNQDGGNSPSGNQMR